MKRIFLSAALCVMANVSFASEPSTLVEGAEPSISRSSTGLYFSLDGSWQQVNLPSNSLGFQLLSPTLSDPRALSISHSIDGSALRGFIGYYLPGDYTHTVLGRNTRFEIGGQYVQASGTSGGTSSSDDGGAVRLNLDGSISASGYACSGGQTCTVDGDASAKYSSWQMTGTFAGDYRYGAMTITPSMGVLGGEAKTSLSSEQTLSVSSSANNAIYEARTTLDWTDLGARIGLNGRAEVAPGVTMGVGGWAGFAVRRASLSGSDVLVDQIIGGFISGSSVVSGVDADTTAFLANIEIDAAYRPMPGISVRAFAGLNFDNKVPSISSATFAGSFSPAATEAASISFHPETSYYAGARVTWAFSP